MIKSTILHRVINSDYDMIRLINGNKTFNERKSGSWAKRIIQNNREIYFERSGDNQKIIRVIDGNTERVIEHAGSKFVCEELFVGKNKVYQRTAHDVENNVYLNDKLIYTHREHTNKDTNEVSVYWIKKHYKNELLIKEETSSGTFSKFKYNKSGKILSKIDHKGNTETYKYDNKGYLIEKATVYNNKKSSTKYTYTNSHKSLYIEEQSDWGNKEISWRKIEYDAAGNEIKNETKYSIETKKFDEKNRLISSKKSNDTFAEVEYKYDDNDNIIYQKDAHHIVNYEYNSSNKLIKKTYSERVGRGWVGFFGFGGHMPGCECECNCKTPTIELNYNENGKILYEKINGKLKFECIYNEAGNIKLENYYNSNGDIEKSYIYEYDENNNLSYSETSDSDGAVLTISMDKLIEKYNPSDDDIFELRRIINF